MRDVGLGKGFCGVGAGGFVEAKGGKGERGWAQKSVVGGWGGKRAWGWDVDRWRRKEKE